MQHNADLQVSGTVSAPGGTFTDTLTVSGIPVDIGGGSGAGFILATELNTAAAQVTVSGIPGTANFIEIRFRLREVGTGGITTGEMTFNNDTASNYDSVLEFRDATGADGSSSIDGVGTSSLPIGFIPRDGTAPGSNFGTGAIKVFDYTSTSHYKRVAMQSFAQNDLAAGSTFSSDGSGQWRDSANPITSVEIFPNTGATLVSGTRLEVIGWVV